MSGVVWKPYLLFCEKETSILFSNPMSPLNVLSSILPGKKIEDFHFKAVFSGILNTTHGCSIQGSKLTLANSQNASDFDNVRVRKISTSKRLRVRIIHVSQTKGKNLLVVSPVC